ncbi:MAG TPA: tetratricopeptide repeat protein, partial [Tepidisphaeraceae bacterium]
MTHRFRFAYLFLLAMITLPCINADLLASPGPENVAVVVNADSWASNTIANEFIHLRQVPPGNVIYLHLGQLRDFEGLNVNDFRARILQPVLDEIARRALTRQIDCIAYSSDIPFSIDCSPDIGKQKIPFFVTPTASASSLTYLYQRVLAKDIDYLSLSANNYVRRVESKRNLHPDRETGKQLAEAFKLIQDKKFEPAATLFESILKDHPGDPDLYYNLACCRANLRQYDEAMEALTKSVENGFWSARHLRNDEDLKPLHERKDFKELLAAIKPLDVSPKPAQGFRSAVGWDAEGVAGDYPDKYLLSTFLAITSGRGNSVHEAIDSLRRSASADGTQPKGTIYFMANDDVRSSTREWAFAAAAKKLKELGVGAEIIEGVLPTKKDDVAGAVVGIAGFEWKASESKILPGAICEHLTSCGGMMRQDDGQTSLTEFIRGGAAGASGAVQEPFAIQDKFPSPFIQVYYAQGSTLAEAFYQSLAGPYQMLIVGDPLCRPWAKIPLVAVSGIEPNAVVKGDVEIKASVKDEQMRVARYELYVDGQKQPGMTVATTALAEGWHELAVVAIAADAVQTRGRATLAFQVNNGGRDLGATVASAEKAPQLLIYAQEGAFD